MCPSGWDVFKAYFEFIRFQKQPHYEENKTAFQMPIAKINAF